MKSMSLTLACVPALLLALNAGAAEDKNTAEKKNQPTQAQLALDHGPHAAVTPAVKRKRLEAGKAASASDTSGS